MKNDIIWKSNELDLYGYETFLTRDMGLNDPDRVDDLLEEYRVYQRDLDEEMGEGNEGTLVEVIYGPHETRFVLSSYSTDDPGMM